MNVSVDLIELPYLLDSFAHARAFCDGPFGASVLAGADAFGLAGIGFVENGFRNVSTYDVAARDPAQLGGLRLRVQQSPINVHLAEAFGAIAVPLPFPRLAEALALAVGDAHVRDQFTHGARRVRDRLPSWEDASVRMSEALEGVGRRRARGGSGERLQR